MAVRELGARLSVDDSGVDHVSAVAHVPAEVSLPSVVLLPGAGGDLHGEGLTALAEVLAAAGAAVVRANLPYRQAGRRPPRADRSIPGLRQVLAGARALLAEEGVSMPVVLGGKSYGGRVASLAVAAERPDDVVGLLFYGYPLHPPGRPDEVRTSHWPRVGVPCCFLQGTRDTFGGPDELQPLLRLLPRRATIVRVEGGDHSLRVTKRAAGDSVARSEGQVLRERVGHDVIRWLGDYRSW